MAVVLYGDGDGGKVGNGLATALGLVVGEARVLAPIALVVGGGALLLDQLIATRRPLRTGGLCIFAAVTLALAAGILGVSSGTPAGARLGAVAVGLPAKPRRDLGPGSVLGDPQARAERGRGHPDPVLARGGRGAVDGRLLGGGVARHRQWASRHQSCDPRARERFGAGDARHPGGTLSAGPGRLARRKRRDDATARASA